MTAWRSIGAGALWLLGGLAPAHAFTVDVDLNPPRHGPGPYDVENRWCRDDGLIAYCTENTYSLAPGVYIGDDGAQKGAGFRASGDGYFDVVAMEYEGGGGWNRFDGGDGAYDFMEWVGVRDGMVVAIRRIGASGAVRFDFGPEFRRLDGLIVRLVYPEADMREVSGSTMAAFLGIEPYEYWDSDYFASTFLLGEAGYCDGRGSNLYRCAIFNVTRLTVAPSLDVVPLPATALLLAASAAGFALFARRRRVRDGR